MSNSLKPPTQKKNALNYRYGQDFTYDNIKFAWRRQGYANKLVVGTVDDALGKGFNVIDLATKKPIEKNDEAQEVLKTMKLDLKKSMYYDRAYGKSLGSFYSKNNIPFWRAYDIRHYYAKYNALGIAEQYNIINKVGGTHAIAEPKEIIGKDLGFVYEIITREDETKGEGISVLEAVWDPLFGLSVLDEQGTYYAIRYGAGIRYMKIPQKKFLDDAYMAKIMAMLKGAIGSEGVYALPYSTVGGVTEEFSINTESAVQIDFTSLKKLILGTISAQTGIPLEVWEGALLGLRASEKNETRYFDYLQSIQDDYRAFLVWVVNKLNELFKWYAKDIIIGIDYIPRVTLSEDEKIETIGKKVDIASKAGYNVDMAWLSEQMGGIPLEEKEIDPLGISAGIGKKDASDETTEDDQDEEEDDE